MCSRKTKILIALFIAFFALSFINIIYSIANYDFIEVGDGCIKVSKTYLSDAKIKNGAGYCFFEKDDCVMLGADLPEAEIDLDVLERLNISEEMLSELNTVKSYNDLKQLFYVNDESLLDIGKVEKYSFQKYYLLYEENGYTVQVILYKEENRTMVHVIKAKDNYFSKKQFNEMARGLQY